MKTTLTDVEYGKNVVEIEANAIKDVTTKNQISATLASTGTPSYWLHSSEAKHGDLGRVVAEDVVIALSNSGETEITQLIPFLKKIGSKIIAITGNNKSNLATYSDIVLYIGNIDEACPSCCRQQ